MCDANTALGMQAAGAATSTVGSYYSAKGQKLSLDSQANIDDINAKLSAMTAQSALLQGQRQEQAVMLKTANMKSSQRATMAANGIDLGGGGTPINVLTSTDVMGQIDANTVKANALRTAFGYSTQATNYQNDALVKRATASGISPVTSAAGTLLTSASQLATNAYLYKKSGAFSTDTTTKAKAWKNPDMPWYNSSSTGY